MITGFGGVALSTIAIVGNVGAVSWRDMVWDLFGAGGKRRAIMTAALLSIPMIPLWAWSHTAVMLAVGRIPDAVHGAGSVGSDPGALERDVATGCPAIFPGLAYQLGNVLSSRNSVLQAAAATKYFGGKFAPVLAITVVVVALVVAVVTALGEKGKGRGFVDAVGEE